MRKITEVTISHDGNTYTIKAENHAQTATVCAGISAILFSLAGALMNNDVKWIKQILKDGYVELCVDTEDPRAKEDIRMAEIGLKQIELGNPGSIVFL